MGKPEGKRQSGRPRLRRKNNSKTDLQKSVGGTWTRLIWLSTRPSGGSCERGYQFMNNKTQRISQLEEKLSFSRRTVLHGVGWLVDWMAGCFGWLVSQVVILKCSKWTHLQVYDFQITQTSDNFMSQINPFQIPHRPVF